MAFIGPAPTLTTSARDSLASADRPTGSLIYNSTNTQFEINIGTGGSPNWQGIGNPAGTILCHGGSSAPGGYLLCNGQAVSRTTYANLFTAIGTTYGVGDGSTTFNVPDSRGRVHVGLSAAGPALINTLGNNDGVAVNSRNVSHHHTGGVTTTTSATPNFNPNTVLTGANTSGDGNNTDYPAFLVVNYIIKF